MLAPEQEELPLEISPENLSPEAFDGVIQNFILREGTDYGLVEVSYEAKVEQVRKQIKSGAVRIVFDLTTETVSLLTDRDFKIRSAKK